MLIRHVLLVVPGTLVMAACGGQKRDASDAPRDTPQSIVEDETSGGDGDAMGDEGENDQVLELAEKGDDSWRRRCQRLGDGGVTIQSLWHGDQAPELEGQAKLLGEADFNTRREIWHDRRDRHAA